MADRLERARRRRRADIVVIVVGVVTLLFAWWFPPVMLAEDTGDVVRYIGAWYWVYVAAGPLAIGAVFVALRAPVVARIMTAAAGLILVAGMVVFDRPGITAVLSLLLPGLLLIGASFFMGPMPTPEEEGMRR